jgi:dihydrofolate reductase
MRRIVMFNWVTADGYFAGPDGNLDWIVPDDEQAKLAAESIPRFDTVLFGRVTYEIFAKFWRHAVEDATTAPDPHRPGQRSRENPGQRSREHHAIAIWLNETTKFVFSRTLKDVAWRNSRLVHELDPREVEAMKKRPGKDMMIFGSGSLVSQLTQHGLIDEYQFVVCPVILGSGRSLLSGVSRSLRLDLLEAKKYQSGDVLLRYARANG